MLSNNLLISIVCSSEEHRRVIYDQINQWFKESPRLTDFAMLAGISKECLDPTMSDYATITDVYHDGYHTVFIDIDVNGPYLQLWKTIVSKNWEDLVDDILYVYTDCYSYIFQTNDPSWESMFYAYVPYSVVDGIYYDFESLYENLLSLLEFKGICSQAKDVYSLKKEFDYLDIQLEILPCQ